MGLTVDYVSLCTGSPLLLTSTVCGTLLVLRQLRVGGFCALAVLVFFYWRQTVLPYFPASVSPSAACRLTIPCTRFVTLDECDYVVAARYRDYDQHSTRASKVVQDILETKEQWQTVRLRARTDSDTGCPLLAYGSQQTGEMHVVFVKFADMGRGCLHLLLCALCEVIWSNTLLVVNCTARVVALFAAHKALFAWTKTGGLLLLVLMKPRTSQALFPHAKQEVGLAGPTLMICRST